MSHPIDNINPEIAARIYSAIQELAWAQQIAEDVKQNNHAAFLERIIGDLHQHVVVNQRVEK
jgi:hypothetical protein